MTGKQNCAECVVAVCCVLLVALAGCGQSKEQAKRDQENKEALAEAMRAEAIGNYHRAEKLLAPILVADPKNSDALFVMAKVQVGRGNMADGIRTLDSISQDGSPPALAALGQSADWMIGLGRLDEAELRLQKLVDQDADFFPAHRRLAQLLNNQGRRIEAAPHMRALARLGVASEFELFGMTTFSDPFTHKSTSPDQVDIPVSTLSLAKQRWYRALPAEAYAIMDKLRTEQTSSTAVSAFWGRLVAERQDDEAFAGWLADRPAGIDSEPEYWAALGNFYQGHDKHPMAVRCFLEAVSRDDTDRHSYLGLARSLAIAGEQEAAGVAMQRFELLDRVAFIATEVDRTAEQLAEMPKLLMQLRRPHEARAWHALAGRTDNAFADESAVTIASEDWIACGIDASKWPLPDLKPLPAESMPSDGDDRTAEFELVDVANDIGLQMQYLPGPPGTHLDFLLMHQTVGGGVGVLDYELDGWPDVYFTQSAGPAYQVSGSETNHLFRNLDGKGFSKVSALAAAEDRGYGQGVTACDINQDGFADLLVANIGTNVMMINNGDGTFSRREYGGQEGSDLWTTSIGCGDLDGDFLPEIVEVNYIDDPSVLRAKCSELNARGRCNPQRFRASVDRFLRQQPDGTFDQLNLGDKIPASYGFAALIANIDDRFGNDLFIANDTNPNHYWQSQPLKDAEQRFELSERGQLLGCAIGVSGNAESCMGVAVGDFDRNGLMDFHITNYTFEASDLYLQQPSGIFSNRFVGYGLETATRPMLGWGTQAVDLDGDGWLDLVALNGHLDSGFTDGTPYRMTPQLFCGGRSGFTDKTSEAGDSEFWTTPALGRTLANIDFNRDGKVDMLAYNIDTPAALLENRTTGGSYVQLELVGTTSDRNAVGAKITVQCGDETWTSWVTAGDGFQCKNESVIHLGLGRHALIDSLRIVWPSGQSSSYADVATDERYLAIEGQRQLYRR